MKQFKSFSFTFHLTRKIVRNLKIQTETMDLQVQGLAEFDPTRSKIDPYNRYRADIAFIYYNGVDVAPLLEFLDDTKLGEIEDAAIRHAAHLFTDSEKEVA